METRCSTTRTRSRISSRNQSTMICEFLARRLSTIRSFLVELLPLCFDRKADSSRISGELCRRMDIMREARTTWALLMRRESGTGMHLSSLQPSSSEMTNSDNLRSPSATIWTSILTCRSVNGPGNSYVSNWQFDKFHQFQGHFLYVTNEEKYGQLIVSDEFPDTVQNDVLHPEMWEIFDNRDVSR